ncbi:FadR/GntR family transcriptional regulator [Pseudaestuariivita rosea]|uniref:FadR/GntR family transcriptional regulator n=1 Tax=Pseudaestuariivita rosea TaxID=2763263 RepID=UPI001ABB597F|nr:GntR family transcriptional regulator [Pseudaestuariivita rosea]
MKIDPNSAADFSAQIAKAIRDAIISGDLIVDDRLPSEQELAEQFDVSRPTIREALKRLAAQSLIRTQRGAFGGAFVRRLSYEEARKQHVTTSTLLLSMNEISFDTACQARFAMERSCVRLVAQNRIQAHLDAMAHELAVQQLPDLSDEAFCGSDVAFHRALVDGSGNPVLSYQMAGAIEAMQPLMNMITFTDRSRAEIVDMHTALFAAATDRDATRLEQELIRLEDYTLTLGRSVFEKRQSLRAARSVSNERTKSSPIISQNGGLS